MGYWSEVKNTYEENDFSTTNDGAIIESISIDAWKVGCDQGSTIAKVLLTISGDVCVVYIDNIARSDPYAQEVVQETVAKLKTVKSSKSNENTSNPLLLNAAWTHTEKVCYIAHEWADKEEPYPCLQDFDYTDMATSAQQFIDCQPSNIDFNTHVENCFDALASECEEKATPEWTIAYFEEKYPLASYIRQLAITREQELVVAIADLLSEWVEEDEGEEWTSNVPFVDSIRSIESYGVKFSDSCDVLVVNAIRHCMDIINPWNKEAIKDTLEEQCTFTREECDKYYGMWLRG